MDLRYAAQKWPLNCGYIIGNMYEVKEPHIVDGESAKSARFMAVLAGDITMEHIAQLQVKPERT